jgi:5-methylcytosine-specific restriction endonuclease McrBC regulatory subunit McrC
MTDLEQRLGRFIRVTPSWNKESVYFHGGARVGTLQVGELRIDVRPRMAAAEMATLIRYALRGDVRPQERSAILPGTVGIDELVCAILADEADRIRQVGLSRRYRKRTESLTALRGRPEFLRSFPRRKQHERTITCTYHLLTCDNLDNRLLRAGLERARLMEITANTRRRLLEHRQAWSSLASAMHPSADDFRDARWNFTRLSEHYRLAHQLCELIVNRMRPTELFAAGQVATAGLTLDMPTLFEQFVHRLIEDLVASTGLRVEAQQPDRGALLDAAGNKYRRVRPDLVVYRKDGPVAVIDAKYKDYWQSRDTAGRPERRISNEDLYQLFFYAQRLQLKHELPVAPEAFIIAPRPASDESRGEEIAQQYRTISWRAGHERAGVVRLLNLPITDILRRMQATSDWQNELEPLRAALLGHRSSTATAQAAPALTRSQGLANDRQS